MNKLFILIISLFLALPAFAADYSENFNTDPTSRWEIQWGGFTWTGGATYVTNTGGGYSIYNTAGSSMTQYAKVKLPRNPPIGGPIFRATSTASDGFYFIIQYANDLIVGRANNTGWLNQDFNCTTGDTFPMSNGDTLSVTLTGTGSGSTVFRAWLNTTNSTPVSSTGWDSAGDTADASCTLNDANTYYDTGARYYTGAGIDLTGAIFDDWYGGDVPVSAAGQIILIN